MLHLRLCNILVKDFLLLFDNFDTELFKTVGKFFLARLLNEHLKYSNCIINIIVDQAPLIFFIIIFVYTI